MGAPVTAAEHVARNRQNVASLLERASRRDERAALFSGLDDDHRARQTADDPIAQREERGVRRRPRYELRQDRSVVLDRSRERFVLRGINPVDSGSEYRDGRRRANRCSRKCLC